jgi:pimeloyl-ACP methyl ester carboxylesterase
MRAFVTRPSGSRYKTLASPSSRDLLKYLDMTASPLHVVTLGSPTLPPLLMMHGWGHSLEALRPLGELLSTVAHVHLIDLPGFGGSPKPETDWDTSQYAIRIAEYLDDKKLKGVWILGHSFGGRVSIQLAARRPELVSKVLLINSGGLLRKRTFRQQLRMRSIRLLVKGAKTLEQLTGSSFLKDRFAARFGSVDYKNAGALRGILVKAVNEDLTMQATQMRQKTLLIWGEYDNETPREMGERLQRLISNSQLIILPGRDHLPFAGAGAHLCAVYIKKFLTEG